MTRKRHIYGINFILWLSFIAFAAVIILLTWLFQTTLLRVFFGAEMTDDLTSVGEEAYDRIGFLMQIPGGEEEINRFMVQVMNENDLVTIYLLDTSGNILYPTEVIDPDGYGFVVEPDVAVFRRAVTYLEETVAGGQDASRGLAAVVSGENYVYIARYPAGRYAVDMNTTGDIYLYVDYSTQLAEAAMGSMRVQLIAITVIVIFLALVISVLLSLWLTKPIKRITRAAKRMAAGDFSVNFKGEYSYAEMDALADTLDYAKEEIGKSDALQKEVLANVTHDLKTPLTMIKAYASMIQEISGADPEKRAKHTQVIIDESDRLTSLVNDILNISKIRSGMDTLKLRRLNLSDFIRTVLERFDYLVETQGFTIEREIEEGLYTEADAEKLEQVVYNLVGNAVNYTGEDKKISIGLHREEKGTLRFTVTDTGKGIPEEERATIWDRYYRSAETHKRPIKGTGLGLSIVKTVLLKHDFRFGVESEVGKGSTFYVLFPEK